MGLFQKIFGRPSRKEIKGYFKSLSAYEPSFYSWRGGIYEAELCRAAIETVAQQAAKLNVRFDGAGKPSVTSLLTLRPAPWLTWSKFMARVATILNADNTAFIVPVTDRFGDTQGICPIKPETWELVDVAGEPFVRFSFPNNEKAAIELSRVGIMVRQQYRSDYFGDAPTALDPTLDLISMQRQGIKQGIKNGASYRFMAHMKTMLNDEDIAAERKKFDQNNFADTTGSGGVLLFPYDYDEIKQINSSPYLVQADELKVVQTSVFNFFGVSEDVIQGKADDSELDAFFNTKIEPFAIQLSEVLTGMLFSENEQRRGNKVTVAANRLQYMSVPHKVQLAKELGDRGAITIDEIRQLFNYPPLPDGAGERAPIRGEYGLVGEGKYDAGEPRDNEEEENDNGQADA